MLPHINAAIVSHSNRGSDEGPSVALVRQATQLVPALMEERIARGERYQSVSIQGEVKVSVALSKRSATYYQPGEDTSWPGAANVIICPNLDMGNLLYNLYATRFPDAQKFPVMFGLRFKGVDLAMDSTPEDIRLAVKASVLRMHRYGAWQETPEGHLLPPLPGAGHQPRIHLHQDLRLRGRPGAFHPGAAALRPGAGALRRAARHRPVRLPQGRHPGLPGQDTAWPWASLDAVAGRGGCSGRCAHGTYTVNEAMAQDLLTGVQGDHASNLGGLSPGSWCARQRPARLHRRPGGGGRGAARAKITGLKASAARSSATRSTRSPPPGATPRSSRPSTSRST